jgi:excisionase family DNA binding protein
MIMGESMAGSYFLKRVLPSVRLPDKASYNVAEACRILQIDRSTVYRLVTQGKLQAAGTDGRLLFYRQFFIDYFKKYDEDSLEELRISIMNAHSRSRT